MNALAIYCFISLVASLVLIGIIVYAVRKDHIYIDFLELNGVTFVELVTAKRRFLLAKMQM